MYNASWRNRENDEYRHTQENMCNEYICQYTYVLDQIFGFESPVGHGTCACKSEYHDREVCKGVSYAWKEILERGIEIYEPAYHQSEEVSDEHVVIIIFVNVFYVCEDDEHIEHAEYLDSWLFLLAQTAESDEYLVQQRIQYAWQHDQKQEQEGFIFAKHRFVRLDIVESVDQVVYRHEE